MSDYHTELDAILDTLINQVEWSIQLPGAISVDRKKEIKAKNEALDAINATVLKHVVGEDEEPEIVNYNEGPHPNDYVMAQNDLKEEQRSIITNTPEEKQDVV